ncbi:hypothetical protein ACHAXT_003477 [Thalassiosira profunda]
MGQLFDTLASTASEKASKATEKAVHATTEAAEAAAKKAKVAATKATNDMRHSMTNVKRDAKQKGEQYAWEAHRTIHRVGEDVKQSAKAAASKASKKVNHSLSDISQSAANRLKKEVAKRMPKMPTMPKLPFSRSQLHWTTKEATERISRAMPSKETRKALVESASNIATETVTKTASNVTTQVQEGANKAMRWLWWWGLAAVGVYGVSTTLTREGVQAVKDMFGSKKSSGSDSTPAVADSVNSTMESPTAEANDDIANRGGLSFWFARRRDKRSGDNGEDSR